METAYALATGQDPDTLEILDKTVILMLPSHNPDGTQKVVGVVSPLAGHAVGGRADPVPLPQVHRPR